MVLRGKTRLLPDNVNINLYCISKFGWVLRSLEEHVLLISNLPGWNVELGKKAPSLRLSQDMSVNLVCLFPGLSNELYLLRS